MLIVLAKAQVGEGSLEPAKAAIADMVAASNAEDGCIAYAFTQDLPPLLDALRAALAPEGHRGTLTAEWVRP